MKYILDESGNPVHEPNIIKWAEWFETANRRVANEAVGISRISTVFLGMSHGRAFETGMPLLWETMVFGGPLDQEQDRCAGTRKQAEAMHARMVERVKKGPVE